MTTAQQREATRQQMLLGAIWRDSDDTSLQGWWRPPPGHDGARVLGAYRGNAGALAERTLAAAFPTLAALVGEEGFAALARDFWHQQAPLRGDLGEWGAALPEFIAASAQLASEPYLADCARLDWHVHQALRAADAPQTPLDLDLLAAREPARIVLQLAAGAALFESAWPVVTIWHAHHQDADTPERFAAARAALAEHRGECAFVCRQGYAARVHRLDLADAAFTAALLAHRPLADALDAAGTSFAFDRWLARALGAGWLVALQPLCTAAGP
jgi:hypothetical protein